MTRAKVLPLRAVWSPWSSWIQFTGYKSRRRTLSAGRVPLAHIAEQVSGKDPVHSRLLGIVWSGTRYLVNFPSCNTSRFTAADLREAYDGVARVVGALK